MEEEERKAHYVWAVDNAIERTSELIRDLKILQEKSKVFRGLGADTLVYIEFDKEEKKHSSSHGKIGFFQRFSAISPYSGGYNQGYIHIDIKSGRYVGDEGFKYMGSTSNFDIMIGPKHEIFIGEEEIDKTLEKFNLTSKTYVDEVKRTSF